MKRVELSILLTDEQWNTAEQLTAQFNAELPEEKPLTVEEYLMAKLLGWLKEHE
jgi:hypothetical protein